jgi:SAM-dependent methyltransferase
MKLLLTKISEKLKEIFWEIRLLLEHYYHSFQIKLSNENPTKLHFGCGSTRMEGFQNVDIIHTPATDHIVDLRRRLPYKNNSIELIFSEHVFEHIELNDLEFLFSECYRILRKDGQLSFSIPEFQKLTGSLLFNKNPDIAKQYKRDLARFTVQFPQVKPEARNAFYVNHLVHQHGEHKFFYTFPVLKTLLKEAGFTKVVERRWNEQLDSKGRKNTSLFVLATKK